MTRLVRRASLLVLFCVLAGCGAPVYLVKPGTADPVHVVRCDYNQPRQGTGEWVADFLVPFSATLSPVSRYQRCLDAARAQGYVEAPEPECAYWRDDAKPGDEIKIRGSCKDNPPEWARKC